VSGRRSRSCARTSAPRSSRIIGWKPKSRRPAASPTRTRRISTKRIPTNSSARRRCVPATSS
jgi:hypothetical protein